MSLLDHLPEAQRPLYEAIQREIAPFVEDESYAQAIARVEMILRGIPVDQDNRLLRAALLARRGELRLEVEDYEQAEEDARHALQNGLRVGPVYAIAGWALYHTESYDEARECFDRALEDDGQHAHALKGRALTLLELEEHALARADLTYAIQREPQDASLHALRAEVHLGLQDLDHARQDLERAHTLDPEDVDYAVALSRVIGAQGDSAGALQILTRATAGEDAVGLDALLLRSHLRLIAGQVDGARADAMSASNRFPDEAFAFVQLAHVQLTEGNTGMALKAAERAVKLDPSLPDAYLARGTARRARGDEAAASEDLRRAASSPPELPAFLFGSSYDAMDGASIQGAFAQALGGADAGADVSAAEEAASAFGGLGGLGGMAGMAGMDPMRMMSQMFDDQGNIRPAFKPLLKMAFKNAPSILKNMPAGMLKNMGGIDPEMLKQMDLDKLSPELLEAQMKEMYQMMQSGEDPRELMQKAQAELERQKKKGGSGDK